MMVKYKIPFIAIDFFNMWKLRADESIFIIVYFILQFWLRSEIRSNDSIMFQSKESITIFLSFVKANQLLR